MSERTLTMWTVFDHPTDYPDHFVARLFEVDADGPRATASIIMATEVDALREVLEFEMGLVRILRSEGDEPRIMETWL